MGTLESPPSTTISKESLRKQDAAQHKKKSVEATTSQGNNGEYFKF